MALPSYWAGESVDQITDQKVPYTFNRAGYYYFSRRVHADLLSHYSYPLIIQGLNS